MLTAAVLAFVPLFPLPQDWTAEGLHEDESVSSCALAVPSEEIKGSRSRGLRVLDGLTGEPLADVHVELWDEEDSRVRCVDRARTARDGSCLLDPHHGASKFIFRKEGYGSEEMGLSTAELVFLYSERPIVGRVLDFQGRPIAGARLATRQSCKHAPHAATAQTDARGQFRMFDFPSSRNSGSIEITAPGFAAESREDETRWWTEIETTGEVVFYLARQPEMRLRLLWGSREPCIGTMFENHERPLMFSTTDSSGHLVFPSWATRRRSWFKNTEGSFFDMRDLPVPRSIPVTVAAGVPEAPTPENLCLLSVVPTIHGGAYSKTAFEDLEAPYIPHISIFTPSGETYVGAGPHEIDNANGTATIVVGEAFRGWRESTLEVALEKGSLNPEIRVERETAVEFVFPSREEWLRSRVEVEGLSTEIDQRRAERWGITLPSGTATFLTEFENGEVRRYSVENTGEVDTISVDLVTMGEVVREGWWTEEVVPVERNQDPELAREFVEIQVDESLPEIARVHCPLVKATFDSRRAELNPLAGPLDVVIEFADGRAVALTLNLRAGEQRLITLR